LREAGVTTDHHRANRTQDSPSDQQQQQPHLPDDEDGHLLYSEGTVLNDRCKTAASFLYYTLNCPHNKMKLKQNSSETVLELF